MKALENTIGSRSDVFTVNFDHIPKVILVFPLFSLNNTRHMMVTLETYELINGTYLCGQPQFRPTPSAYL